MKNFNQINIGYREETVILYFTMPEGKSEAIIVETDLDVSRDNIPLAFELFDASDIGAERLAFVIAALKTGGLKFSYDPPIDSKRQRSAVLRNLTFAPAKMGVFPRAALP